MHSDDICTYSCYVCHNKLETQYIPHQLTIPGLAFSLESFSFVPWYVYSVFFFFPYRMSLLFLVQSPRELTVELSCGQVFFLLGSQTSLGQAL